MWVVLNIIIVYENGNDILAFIFFFLLKCVHVAKLVRVLFALRPFYQVIKKFLTLHFGPSFDESVVNPKLEQ